jgi:MacB-like periplasmic core domain
MRILRTWLSRMGALFGKPEQDRELDAELSSHLEMHVAHNLRAGMDPSEARRQALIKLGGLEQTKENCRDRRGLPFIETVLEDLRFAARTLRKNGGFTTIAVLTLALGIGANTAIFSMVNALLLHPYDFRNLDRIALVWEDQGAEASFDDRSIAPADASDIASSTDIFDSLATYRCRTYSLSLETEVLPADGCDVSANFFDLLVTPAVGRSFARSEQQPGLDAVAVGSDDRERCPYARPLAQDGSAWPNCSSRRLFCYPFSRRCSPLEFRFGPSACCEPASRRNGPSGFRAGRAFRSTAVSWPSRSCSRRQSEYPLALQRSCTVGASS